MLRQHAGHLPRRGRSAAPTNLMHTFAEQLKWEGKVAKVKGRACLVNIPLVFWG